MANDLKFYFVLKDCGIFILLCCPTLTAGIMLSNGNNSYQHGFNFTFSPSQLDRLYENSLETINVNVSCTRCDYQEKDIILKVDTRDRNIAMVQANSTITAIKWLPDSGVRTGNVVVEGVRLGLTYLTFKLEPEDVKPTGPGEDPDDLISGDYRIIVLRRRGVVDDVYRYGIIVFSVIIYLGFGAKLDFQEIKAILKKPIGPAIGIGCQFIIMPLVSFGVAKALRLDNNFAFGLFAMGCSPGGGASNVFTNLLDGNLDLSITMTAISTIFSLGFMPFWMFAFSRYFISARVQIPYVQLIRSLAYIIAPLVVGAIINKFAPKGGKVLVKITKPISLIFVVFVLSFGIYANLYSYKIMVTVPNVIVGAILLPYIGFVLGYLVAWMGRQPRRGCTAISIETGYQNPSIPIIILTGNFPQPEGDLGVVMPLTTSLFTPFPLMIAYVILLIHKRVKRKKTGQSDYVNDILDHVNQIDITINSDQGSKGN